MGTGKTIIAIHGAGMSAAAWDSLKPLLAGHDLRAVSLPGHGDGAAPLPDIAAMADWLRAKIGTGSCILLGHSMGALVALKAAVGNPAVEGIILCGAAAEMPVNADLLRTAFETPDKAAALVLKWGVSSAHPAADSLRATLKETMHPAALGVDLKACDDFKEGVALAAALDVPALVICGAADKMAAPAAGRALAGLIRGAVCAVLADGGHMMMAEQPHEISLRIMSFLER